jgi:heterodisulfide reductase subunit A
MERIGILFCCCDWNGHRDLLSPSLISEIKKIPTVVHVEEIRNFCLQWDKLKDLVTEKGLQEIILFACSATLQEGMFRNIAASAGLEPDHVSVIEKKGLKDTPESIPELISQNIKALKERAAQPTVATPIIKKALVIGGGAAGIQASLDIADGGYEVYLVEQLSTIGGHMLQLSETFPTLDCPQCIMTPKMVEINQHKNVHLMTYSEVDEVSGEIGRFKVRIRRKTPYVDWSKCTGCDDCTKVCPVELYSEWDRGIASRKAVYKHFAQAVPNKFTIQKKGIPFCRAACPIHVNAQGYVQLVKEGRFDEALKVIQRVLPFPGVMGRICVHPCETKCKRGEVDKPIAICTLKRSASDAGKDVEPDLTIEEEKKEKVAIIGAGPAGLLAAYDLRKRGYKVTVFDALPFAGGTLRVGIPAYRLPREIMEREFSTLEKMGVEFRFNTLIGKDVMLDKLRGDYQAIFIAIGAHVSTKLGVPGEDLKGVVQALDFLRAVNLNQKVKVGETVAVIGGGNTAIDAARVALRLGAQEVSILYRRSRSEMPANESEIEEAEHEGIKIHLLVAPVEVIGEAGKVKQIKCIRMRLGEPDASGRGRPIPIAGSEFLMDVAMVIPAIGQSPDVAVLGRDVNLELSRNGTVKADPVTLMTSIEGIFAGGDVVSGPASAVEALAAGRKAAISIERYLKGEDLYQRREGEGPREVDLDVDTSKVVKKQRAKMPTIPLPERQGNFEEVDLGFTLEQAQEEAGRCLNCADCCECFSCVDACKALAIDHTMQDQYEEIEVGAIVLATGYELLSTKQISEFETDPDVLDGLQFERILAPSGPTDGVVIRPSDRKIPKEVVFISCVGSRDPEHFYPYCSRICCMYLAKMAMLYKHAVPDGQAYIFYIDIRSTGKGYEEFIQRAVEEDKVVYLRGRVSRLFRENGKIRVYGVDTLSGKQIEINADLVVLGMAMIPNPKGVELIRKLNLATDQFGFLSESHGKMKPMESLQPGIFIAGTAQSPKDVPDTVAQASAAASKVLTLFAQEMVIKDYA